MAPFLTGDTKNPGTEAFNPPHLQSSHRARIISAAGSSFTPQRQGSISGCFRDFTGAAARKPKKIPGFEGPFFVFFFSFLGAPLSFKKKLIPFWTISSRQSQQNNTIFPLRKRHFKNKHYADPRGSQRSRPHIPQGEFIRLTSGRLPYTVWHLN